MAFSRARPDRREIRWLEREIRELAKSLVSQTASQPSAGSVLASALGHKFDRLEGLDSKVARELHAELDAKLPTDLRGD